MFSLNDGLLFDLFDDPQLCAVIEGGRLVDVWTADSSFSGLGSVHLARVTGRFDQHKRLTGQLADGSVISWRDNDKIKRREGQLALVTLAAAAREGKPVQAVSGIELAGRYVTLRWHGKVTGQVQISRRLRPSVQLDQQRKKVKRAFHDAGLLNSGFTLIIRRSSFSSDSTISADLLESAVVEADQMIRHWQSFSIMPQDLRVEKEARIVYTGYSLMEKLRQNDDNKSVRILSHEDWKILHEQVDLARQPDVIAKGGGLLYIEQTRAAFMIDVDSASSKQAPLNLCTTILPDLFAAMRLRRLAGKIIVDMPFLTNSQREKYCDRLMSWRGMIFVFQIVLGLPSLAC